MKVPDKHEINDYVNAITVGGIKGSILGVFASGGLYYYLRTRTSFFKQAGGFHKTLALTSPIIFCGITWMEVASTQFEESRPSRQEPVESPGLAAKRAAAQANTAPMDAVKNFFGEHKYKVVVAGWAASMGGSFYLVNRDKIMTKSQKIVQARVYAQGLTVLMLLATVLLSVSTTQTRRAEEEANAHNSWERNHKYVQTPRAKTPASSQ